ncbi:MAG TPA: integrase core domain-containing protein [Candidatus Limosilactobacillus merdigallinarum]|uniref:Integrase core domain-containing protein n=1 Tax=Candidatus Limosilactobacillus merdigallinarum TaxID=2838652 RepID=A0A9D2AK46_9LACO|nr:integrase core domain-containing protein [Candidatus Limosilactobacillus merdigallinarum]
MFKRECLKRIETSSIKQLQDVVQKYVHWFNYERISLNKNGLTPIEYRNQSIN